MNWEGEWWAAVVREVSDDAYEVEWVDEPEVFNRVDATDVSRAVFMTHGGRGWLVGEKVGNVTSGYFFS